MSNNFDHNREEDLEKIEEDLIREDKEKRKEEMLVSGKSVFEIKRMKDTKSKMDHEQNEPRK